MKRIVATPEQVTVIAESTGDVQFVDASGKYLGTMTRDFTEEDIQIALARSKSEGSCRTTEQVLERIRLLEASENGSKQ